tara:strand:- start:459 stop:881 length:423 start_codon:yes stop_codon:yes gene_type:complete
VTTVEEVKKISFTNHTDNDGYLVPLESLSDQIPFDIKRVFYVYGVKDQKIRGKHAHLKTEQVLICLSGECRVICKDGKTSKELTLNSPTEAVYIPNLIWDEQIYKTRDTILLVLSSTTYDRSDYIEDWEQFVSENNDPNR